MTEELWFAFLMHCDVCQHREPVIWPFKPKSRQVIVCTHCQTRYVLEVKQAHVEYTYRKEVKV